jgi:arylsulfatase A-like enzyme/tetratricopeptide (TPR) repeat protein
MTRRFYIALARYAFRVRPSRLMAIALVLVVAVAGLLWLRRGRPPSVGAPTRPNILLITIDTLRADRVGRELTPAINELASRGASFDRARTAVPLTLPSHVTMMTGILPPQHGVRENGMVLRSGTPTLARILRTNGYHTAAFVGAYVLDHRFGLADGFDVYDDNIPRDPGRPQLLESERRGGQVVDAALSWLKDARPPFFVWIHLFDPHAPYDPPEEYLAKARGQPYDGEVAYADAQVGRISEALRQRNMYEDAVIVLAGDHGEGLGEHGEQTHGMLAYDSTLQVPLVLVAPADGVRGRIGAPVSLADLPRSILSAAHVTAPESMGGSPLFSPGGRDVYAETEYPRKAGWHPIAALVDPRWKLLLSSEPELYDLRDDPAETRNVASSHAALVERMTQRVGQLAQPRSAETPQIDAETSARLRSLGYVSGPPAPVAGTAPNPARVIQEWTIFERALAELNDGRARDALPALELLAAKFPGSTIFEGAYARALMEAGQPAAALRRYRALVKRHSRDAMLFHDLAVAARTAGDRAEAMRAEQAALALDQDNPAALNGLGLLHADAGRAGEAAVAFARAAQIDPRNPSHWSNLGNARREIGDVSAAEMAYRRALNVDPNYPDALNGLGVLLVQRGAAKDARPFFTRALEQSPDFYEARLNLGIAYQQSGEAAKAAETYRELLAKAPPSASRERSAARKLLNSLRR